MVKMIVGIIVMNKIVQQVYDFLNFLNLIKYILSFIFLVHNQMTMKNNCLSNHFKCSNGKCINKLYRCDGDDDCGDSLNTSLPSSDERNCRK